MQAEVILQHRPFNDIEDLKFKLGQGSKRKTGPAGLSPNLLSDCIEILKNYGVVDDVLERCEKIGEDINRVLNKWTIKQALLTDTLASDTGALGFSELDQISADVFLRSQPATLSDGVTLKEYQLIGLNWLDLLYTKKRSCILADEMGKQCSDPDSDQIQHPRRARKNCPSDFIHRLVEGTGYKGPALDCCSVSSQVYS